MVEWAEAHRRLKSSAVEVVAGGELTAEWTANVSRLIDHVVEQLAPTGDAWAWATFHGINLVKQPDGLVLWLDGLCVGTFKLVASESHVRFEFCPSVVTAIGAG